MDQGSSRRRGILATVLAFPVAAGVATAGYVDGWFDPGAAFITGTAAPPAEQPPSVVTDLRGQNLPIPGTAVPRNGAEEAALPELGPAEDDAEVPRPAGTGPEEGGPSLGGGDDGDDDRAVDRADDGAPADDGTNEGVGDDGAGNADADDDADAGGDDGGDDGRTAGDDAESGDDSAEAGGSGDGDTAEGDDGTDDSDDGDGGDGDGDDDAGDDEEGAGDGD
jgi:hypothetical protein